MWCVFLVYDEAKESIGCVEVGDAVDGIVRGFLCCSVLVGRHSGFAQHEVIVLGIAYGLLLHYTHVHRLRPLQGLPCVRNLYCDVCVMGKSYRVNTL